MVPTFKFYKVWMQKEIDTNKEFEKKNWIRTNTKMIIVHIHCQALANYTIHYITYNG
jgi:hypothetical protein